MTMRCEDTRQFGVYSTLRSDILGGRYASVRFPSERSLAMRFKVSRATIARCLADLNREGLIVRSHGRGTFITQQGLSRKIGLVLPGIVPYSEYFQPIVSELMRIAQAESFELRLGSISSRDIKSRTHEVRELAAEFIKNKVAGIIYQPLEYVDDADEANARILAVFKKVGIPVVLLDSDILPPPSRSPYDCVTIDNVDAGECVANHLFERGAKNVRFFMLPGMLSTVAKRIRGVICSAVLHGHRWTHENVVVAQPDDRKAVRRLMRGNHRPDAIICENDMVADVLLTTLAGLNVKVPDDVMLAGFDDMQRARLATPTLTSIHQPYAEIAKSAFCRLVSRISRPDLPTISISLPAPLVIRDSTKRKTPTGTSRGMR